MISSSKLNKFPFFQLDSSTGFVSDANLHWFVKSEDLRLFDFPRPAGAREVFDQYMEKSMLEDGNANFKFTICRKQALIWNNMRNHIESTHFPFEGDGIPQVNRVGIPGKGIPEVSAHHRLSSPCNARGNTFQGPDNL